MFSVLGGERIAFLGKGNFKSLEFGPLLQFFIPSFDDSILHLQRVIPHERLSLFDQLFMLIMLIAYLFVLLLVIVDLLAL